MKHLPVPRDESSLFRHGSLMIGGSLFGAMFNAGFHMVVGRNLPGAEYGSLVAMTGIILAVTTPMLALQNTLAHFTAKLVLDGRRDAVMDLFLHWIHLFAGLSLALVAGAVVFRGPLAAFWGGVDPRLVVLTFTVLAASLWMSLFTGLLQGMQSFVWLAFAPQAWGAVRLALGWAFTAYFSATALAAIGAQGIGVLMVLVLCLWAVVSMRLPRVEVPSRRPHGTYRYLASAFVCLAGYALLMNLDTTLAKHYFDAETAGVFAKAATIARMAVFLPVPIATVLFPKVTSTGELTDPSWRLLVRALAFAGLIIGGVAAGCLAFPQLPWMILYNAWTPAEAALASALTRAMVLAMVPLALVYLLLNFQMAQRRFRWGMLLVPCGAAYVIGVRFLHDSPLQIAAVLGTLNLIAAVILTAAVLIRRTRR